MTGKIRRCLIRHHGKKHIGDGGTAPRILNLSIRCKRAVKSTPTPPYLRSPTQQQSEWAPTPVWTLRRREEPLDTDGNQTLTFGHQVHSQGAVMTELSRLSNIKSANFSFKIEHQTNCTSADNCAEEAMLIPQG